MRHLEDIRALVTTLQKSTRFHALVIESPPGWAKSSTVEAALSELGIPFASLGSYATPLALYNAFCDNPSGTLVLDDCAGLFGDAAGMALLKAATWASAGSQGERRVAWSSTSEKVAQPFVVFTGNVILLTNGVPQGRETAAFLSRTLYLPIRFDGEQIAQMLKEAAASPKYFENGTVANEVAELLGQRACELEVASINLRTLQMAYEIAVANPGTWQVLLERLIPKADPRRIVETLAASRQPVEEQAREFCRMTGLSRRTFFNYRKEGEAPRFDAPR